MPTADLYSSQMKFVRRSPSEKSVNVASVAKRQLSASLEFVGVSGKSVNVASVAKRQLSASWKRASMLLPWPNVSCQRLGKERQGCFRGQTPVVGVSEKSVNVASVAERQLLTSLEFGAVEEVEGAEIDRCSAEEEAEEEEESKKMMVEAPKVKVMERSGAGKR